MADFLQAFRTALRLIVTLDPRLIEIMLLSLKVSLIAVAIASMIGFALGGALAVYRFPGRGAAATLLSALMGLPPVMAGLFVYLLLSNAGPLGVLQLLYTPTAMIIAQVVLVVPIIAALTRQACEDLLEEYDEQLRSLGASSRAIVVHAVVGRPIPADHSRACRLRAGHRRGRRCDDRRRQYRPCDPHHDHGDSARDLEGRNRAGACVRYRPSRSWPSRSTWLSWVSGASPPASPMLDQTPPAPRPHSMDIAFCYRLSCAGCPTRRTASA